MPSEKKCVAYVVPVSISDADFVSLTLQSLRLRSIDMVVVLTAEPTDVSSDPVDRMLLSSSSSSLERPGAVLSRRLQPITPTPIAVPQINVTPEIITGLLVSLLLIFFTSVGLTCVMSVKTPDVMHSTTLPAGREY